MKKVRFPAVALAVMLLLSLTPVLASGASFLPVIGGEMTAAGVRLNNPNASRTVLTDGSVRIDIPSKDGDGTLFVIPLSGTVNLIENPYLTYEITGNDIDLIWALDFVGTARPADRANGRRPDAVDVHSGADFGHVRAPMSGSVNVAELLDGYVANLASVSFTEIRLWTVTDSGTYTVNTFGFGPAAASVTTSTPTTTAPVVSATTPPVNTRSASTNDTTPFYLALLGLGLLLAAAVVLPKAKKN
jgi:LPXTG-motif cell wall-anchored protein